MYFKSTTTSSYSCFTKPNHSSKNVQHLKPDPRIRGWSRMERTIPPAMGADDSFEQPKKVHQEEGTRAES